VLAAEEPARMGSRTDALLLARFERYLLAERGLAAGSPQTGVRTAGTTPPCPPPARSTRRRRLKVRLRARGRLLPRELQRFYRARSPECARRDSISLFHRLVHKPGSLSILVMCDGIFRQPGT